MVVVEGQSFQESWKKYDGTYSYFLTFLLCVNALFYYILLHCYYLLLFCLHKTTLKFTKQSPRRTISYGSPDTRVPWGVPGSPRVGSQKVQRRLEKVREDWRRLEKVRES